MCVRGPAVAVHRARRRLQPGAHRARQRDHQRDHARPHAQAGARALRRDHRLRRARGVRRPEAEELLVGDERAARVRGRGPGRRRRAAGGRGARGRRRGVPAEVLRPVRPDEGRGPHDPLRDARHGRASSASATGRWCSSAARCWTIGDPEDISRKYSELNFGAAARLSRTAAGTGGPSCRCTTRGARTSAASGSSTLATGRALRRLLRGRVRRRGGGPGVRGRSSATR